MLVPGRVAAGFAGLCAAIVAPAQDGDHPITEPGLRFLKSEGIVEASGVSEGVAPERVLSVRVRVRSDSEVPSVAGTYARQNGRLQFSPTFGFDRGIDYEATLSIPGAPSKILGFRIPIPEGAKSPSTAVRQVFPSGGVLPANHLRFYIHFSAPMSRGHVEDCIRLLDDAGKPVNLPFLLLSEELWSPDGKRLTLFLDPARVKRGLLPREQEGPVLVEGKSYTLEVTADFHDAEGRPLREGFRRKFRVEPAKYSQPAPGKWKLKIPGKSTRDPLEMAFPHSLDHAMLHRMIEIIGMDDATQGTVSVSGNERVWRFIPDHRWEAGSFRIRIDRLLEDSCGNSIERLFEVSRAQGRIPVPERRFSYLEFTIPED